jgi:hypothetical protein
MASQKANNSGISHGTLVNVLGVLAIVGVCGGLGYRAFAPQLTVTEVERRVDEVLPLGSSWPEVDAWLRSNGIRISYMGSAGEDIGLDTTCNNMTGTIYNTGPRIEMYREGIEISFLFDGKGSERKLIERRVRSVQNPF